MKENNIQDSAISALEHYRGLFLGKAFKMHYPYYSIIDTIIIYDINLFQLPRSSYTIQIHAYNFTTKNKVTWTTVNNLMLIQRIENAFNGIKNSYPAAYTIEVIA
jgi:hypothetical protein